MTLVSISFALEMQPILKQHLSKTLWSNLTLTGARKTVPQRWVTYLLKYWLSDFKQDSLLCVICQLTNCKSRCFLLLFVFFFVDFVCVCVCVCKSWFWWTHLYLTSVNSIYYVFVCFLGIHNSEWRKMLALWEFTDQKGKGISKHSKSSMSDQYQGEGKGKQNTVDTYTSPESQGSLLGR